MIVTVVGCVAGNGLARWYGTRRTHDDGTQLRATVKDRWHFFCGPHFGWMYGYPLKPKCH